MKKGDVPDSKFDSTALNQGTNVEKEHTDDPEIAKQIAKAHLSEHPEYYKALKIIEKGLK